MLMHANKLSGTALSPVIRRRLSPGGADGCVQASGQGRGHFLQILLVLVIPLCHPNIPRNTHMPTLYVYQ